MIRQIAIAATLIVSSTTLAAQTAPEAPAPPPEAQTPAPQVEGPMTLQRLALIVQALDPQVIARGPTLEFTLDDIPVIVVADAAADRMRAMVPIASAQGLSDAEMRRLMQANFDTALDARYAIANGRLWGVFIHPLSPLERDQFISGLIQTINVARTFGQTYSGGAQVFGGGDSNGIYQELFEELRKKGEAL
ncbi:hypothetical protein [Sulfitobacter sp. S190]|uniref:hypothetical protein n=1 Tax=Sulfitobacter sp. S190 TaxID=2867022 RepID=UPI0021A420DD|nr:hypothetical protein [Sulfitobacter sp. S190]UWR23269.1 hypothetical protein K3756_04560 [Sulfitobacter sp. S190]